MANKDEYKKYEKQSESLHRKFNVRDIVSLLTIRFAYIPAYKSKNFGQFFALKVRGLTYTQV